jgi:hypothetical protein
VPPPHPSLNITIQAHKRQLWWWGLVLERLAQMDSAKPIKSYAALKKGARPEHKLQ